MRPTGPVLFARPGFEQACLKIIDRSVRDAIFAALLQDPSASRRALRNVAMEAAIIMAPGLLEPGPAIHQASNGSGSGPVEMTCVVPVTGETKLFSFSPPIWPPARQVRGAVTAGKLILSAEAWADGLPWLPAVLASEVAEVTRILAAQQAVISHWDKELSSAMRRLVDKIHSQVDADLLRSILDLAIRIETDAPAMGFASHFIVGKRSQLWSEWTK